VLGLKIPQKLHVCSVGRQDECITRFTSCVDVDEFQARKYASPLAKSACVHPRWSVTASKKDGGMKEDPGDLGDQTPPKASHVSRMYRNTPCSNKGKVIRVAQWAYMLRHVLCTCIDRLRPEPARKSGIKTNEYESRLLQEISQKQRKRRNEQLKE